MALNILFTLILCILLVELAVRLPFAATLSIISRVALRAPKVISSSRISDHWKEKAVGAYAGRMFVSSFKLAIYLALLLLVATAIIVALGPLETGFDSFILGWTGISLSLIFATGWYYLRKVFRRG